MQQITDEELLKLLKNCESEFYTLAEIHKTLIQSNIQTTIDELRRRIYSLFRDGYLGNEPTGDGVNVYYIIFCPEQ
jgi:arginase family enzyme